MNTRASLTYRRRDGETIRRHFVFRGTPRMDLVRRALSVARAPGLIPGAVGLAAGLPWTPESYDPELDHAWLTCDHESFGATLQAPTESLTFQEFVRRVEREARKGWDPQAHLPALDPVAAVGPP